MPLLRTTWIDAFRTPIVTRIFFANLMLFFSSRVLAQDEWTETDILRLARERSPEGLLATAEEEFANQRADVAPLWPNPAFAWDREAGFGGEVPDQDAFRASIPLTPAGRWIAERRLARSESAELRAAAWNARDQALERALTSFYSAVAAASRVALLEAASHDLDEAAGVLSSREEAGAASGYERMRLTLESELARSRTNEAIADLAQTRATLLQLLAPERTSLPNFVGTLETAEPASLTAYQSDARERANALELRRASEEASDAQRAARLGWLPIVRVTGGLQILHEESSAHGYVVGVSMDIPTIDVGQDVRAEAEGRAQVTLARAEASERQRDVEIAAARSELIAAQNELRRFEAATRGPAEDLFRAAESGYREGQLTIVELLDAQRARTDVALRQLQLAEAAKRAEVRLRARTGGLQ